MKNKICLIGGAGFLGSHLINSYHDDDLTVIDILEEDKLISNNFNYVNYRKSGFEILAKEKFDFIFFLAGNASVSKSIEDPLFDITTNTILLLELLEIVKNNPTKIIFTSSAACLGETSKNLNIPISPYGVSKLASENYLRVYSNLYSIPILICRIFSMYGENNTKQMIYETVKRLDKDSTNLTIYNPKSVRDFVYVGEVVEMIKYLTIHSDFDCKIYDLGNGVSIPVEEMAKKIINIMEISPHIKMEEIKNLGDPVKQISDIRPLISLGYVFKYIEDKGIINTVKWALSN